MAGRSHCGLVRVETERSPDQSGDLDLTSRVPLDTPLSGIHLGGIHRRVHLPDGSDPNQISPDPCLDPDSCRDLDPDSTLQTAPNPNACRCRRRGNENFFSDHHLHAMTILASIHHRVGVGPLVRNLHRRGIDLRRPSGPHETVRRNDVQNEGSWVRR